MSMPGPMELLVIAVLALIVFGPKRLPEIGKSFGTTLNEFKKAIASFDQPVQALPPSHQEPETPSPKV